MDRGTRRLILRALEDDGDALRSLGLRFLYGAGWGKDRRLARAFLRKAAMLGDAEAFAAYHYFFERKKKVIDDGSYREIYLDYRKETDQKRKRELFSYLKAGTKGQRRELAGKIWETGNKGKRKRRKEAGRTRPFRKGFLESLFKRIWRRMK